jgi:hypothetical protein
MLTGVDQDFIESFPEFSGNGRALDELWAGADDGSDSGHGQYLPFNYNASFADQVETRKNISRYGGINSFYFRYKRSDLTGRILWDVW